MQEHVKVEFAKACVNSAKPTDLPQFYIDLYDLLGRHGDRLISQQVPPRTQHAMVATIAESLHDRDLTIRALIERVQAIEARLDEVEVLEDEEDPPATEQPIVSEVVTGQIAGATEQSVTFIKRGPGRPRKVETGGVANG